MMEAVGRGEIWWTDLPEPLRSEPGYRRPVLAIQADSFNGNRTRTVIGAGLTRNLDLGDFPGNGRTRRGWCATPWSAFPTF